ncbi:unnamed protein product [Cylindrotheca closterium]|uniref:Uncharacterized protein n=1 Tax=Cylindrotheca closterium TaxID=2856 RepID=A0AAD2GCX5_9STRA|nr:unnamed protein product [Cylindrotheca closterium]
MKLSLSSFLFFSLATQALAISSDREDFETTQRKLATAYGTNFFVESKDTEYNAYQTAWRYLGHIVKCGYPSDRYDEDNNDSKSHDSREGYTMGNNYCQRFLLWAAYVDPNYQGGGIGEYMVYDTDNQGYDYSACQTTGSSRCVEMDCHDSNTETWKLMGVYKEAVWYGGDAFFEQLFKHEAYCIWNDDDIYEFMSDAREQWTAGCIDTGYTDEWGNAMYIDLKPGYNGNMAYSLYKDDICQTEYNGSHLDLDTVATSIGLLSQNYLYKWNAYMEPFKVCQPCKAYNLQAGRRERELYEYGNNNYQWGGNYNYNNNNNNNNNYNNNNNNYNNYYNDDNKGHFQCDDDAGYTNVNQCMKLRSHADLEIATWEDLVIGTEQGGIMEIKIGETYFGTKKMTTSQAQYMQSLMKQKAQEIQDEEDEYKHMLESLPSSTVALIFGFLLMSMGMAALAGSVYFALKKMDKIRGGTMGEPLILKKLGIRTKKLKSYINFKRKERQERKESVGVV